MQPGAYATLQGAADAAVEAAVDIDRRRPLLGARHDRRRADPALPARWAGAGGGRAAARRLHDQLKSHWEAASSPSRTRRWYQRPLLGHRPRRRPRHDGAALLVVLRPLPRRARHAPQPADDRREGRGRGGRGDEEEYDLHARADALWADHMEEPFQTVASDVDMEDHAPRKSASWARNSARNSSAAILARFGAQFSHALSVTSAGTGRRWKRSTRRSKRGGVRWRTRQGAGVDGCRRRQLQRKKGEIDASHEHRDGLLEQIKLRSLDSFYEIEECVMERLSLPKDDLATLTRLMADGEGGGSVDDRLRLFLRAHDAPAAERDRGGPAVARRRRAGGADLRPLEWLKREQAFQSAVASRRPPTPPAPAAAAACSARRCRLGLAIADKAGVGGDARAAGSAALTAGSALAQGVKQLPPARETAITRAVKALMENKPPRPTRSRTATSPCGPRATSPPPRASLGLRRTPSSSPSAPATTSSTRRSASRSRRRAARRRACPAPPAA